MKRKSKLKILLSKLPAPQFSFSKQWGNIPLGIGYLKAMVYRENLLKHVNIKILDYTENDLSGDAKLIDTVLEENPVIFGLSLYEWNSLRSLYIAKKIKQKLQNVKIIVGGPEVTRRDSPYIMDCDAVDIGCFGAGESAFINIIKHCLSGNSDYSDIKGIFYRTAEGVHLTSENEPIKKLDYAPSPYLLGIINPENYAEVWVETTRGCINKCSYCISSSLPFTTFSSKRVSEEIKYLMGKNIKTLRVLDNDFICNPNFKTICLLLKKFNRKQKVDVRVWFQPEHLNEKAVKLMRYTGIKEIEVGLQSANPITLANIHRKVSLIKFSRGIKLLKENKFDVRADLIIGLPGDKKEDVRRTIKFCKDNKISFGPFLLEVLPNAELRKQADKFGIKYRKEPPYTMLSSRYLSRNDIKETFSLFNYKGYSCPVPDLVTYSNPNIFNEFSAFFTKNAGAKDNNSNIRNKLITTLIFNLDRDLQDAKRLTQLGKALRRNVASPLTIWFKSKNIGRDADLIKILLQSISQLNPFLLWNIILETSNKFPNSIIVDIEKIIKCKEKIFDHFKIYKPINLYIALPWGKNGFDKMWLENLSRYASFLWYLNLSENNEWQKNIKNIFKEEKNSPFLLDFVYNSKVEFVIKAQKLLIEEWLKAQNLERRHIGFRNLILNYSFRNKLEGFEISKFPEIIGSKIVFNDKLVLSYALEQNSQIVLDSIEWQKKFEESL